jgi:hypothetical protein
MTYHDILVLCQRGKVPLTVVRNNTRRNRCHTSPFAYSQITQTPLIPRRPIQSRNHAVHFLQLGASEFLPYMHLNPACFCLSARNALLCVDWVLSIASATMGQTPAIAARHLPRPPSVMLFPPIRVAPSPAALSGFHRPDHAYTYTRQPSLQHNSRSQVSVSRLSASADTDIDRVASADLATTKTKPDEKISHRLERPALASPPPPPQGPLSARRLHARVDNTIQSTIHRRSSITELVHGCIVVDSRASRSTTACIIITTWNWSPTSAHHRASEPPLALKQPSLPVHPGSDSFHRVNRYPSTLPHVSCLGQLFVPTPTWLGRPVDRRQRSLQVSHRGITLHPCRPSIHPEDPSYPGILPILLCIPPPPPHVNLADGPS